MKRVRTAIAALGVLAMAATIEAHGRTADAQAKAADASGTWELSVTTPNGPYSAGMVLKKDGDKLTGRISGPQGEVDVAGTQKANAIEIGFAMQTQNGQLNVAMTGTQDGDSMRGIIDIGQGGQFDWSGKRTSKPDAQDPKKSEAVDVTGTWDFQVSSQVSNGSRTVVLKQTGEKVTGTYSGQYGESALEGSIKGKELTFAFTLQVEGTAIEIRYYGEVEKDTMKGTFTMGELGEGSFTAKRKQ
jgi:hypothetical protein